MIIPKKVSPKEALRFLNKCAKICGMTPQAFMEAAGMGRTTKWRWENGVTEPDRGSLLKIQDACNKLKNSKR